MKTFPMFLKLENRTVVIAGGGEQAMQKCRLMLKTPARIVVLAEALEPELAGLVEDGRVLWDKGPITVSSFEQVALAFIATGCPGTDAALHALAEGAGALVNVVDQPDLCDAITPSIVDRSPVVVAIGTEGTAPVLARQIKTRLEDILEPRLGDLAALAGRLRGAASARLQPRQRRDLWRWVFGDQPRTLFRQGQERDAAKLIKTAIEQAEIPAAAPTPVALVGAGAGSADLITLRGVQRLQEADIIFYDRLTDPGLLELARRDAERIFVGKTPGCADWPQDRINARLVAAARLGQRVVRLKCGDPGIFARGAEEAAVLAEAGVACEVVPGVTAASVAAASAGGFLTERGTTNSLVLTTATNADGQLNQSLKAHLSPGTSMAIYMGVGKAAEIEEAVRATPWAGDVSARITESAGTANERHVTCKGLDLAATIAAHEISAPAIIHLVLPKRQAAIMPLPQTKTG